MPLYWTLRPARRRPPVGFADTCPAISLHEIRRLPDLLSPVCSVLLSLYLNERVENRQAQVSVSWFFCPAMLYHLLGVRFFYPVGHRTPLVSPFTGKGMV